MSGEEYVCNLNEASLEKAKKELNEDPKERQGAVDTFRQWIVQQPHIRCPTETSYLIRYLRVAKFSQLVAREKLTGYLSFKSEFPKWFSDINTGSKAIQAVIDCGYMVPLPGTDQEGRKIILGREGALDTSGKVYTIDDVMKAVFGMMIQLLIDENNQVNGFIYFMDMSSFSIKHQTFWGYDGIVNSTKCFEGGVPGRFKGFYCYNEGPLFDAIMAISKPFMSKKTLSRMCMFGDNLEKVYKSIPKRMLPEEYLPDEYKGPSAGPLKSLIKEYKEEMESERVRQLILSYTKAEYGIDKKSAPSDVPNASFRKLNIE